MLQPAAGRHPRGVTVVGQNAFSKCTSLPTVRVPASVVTVGEHAFSGCTALASADLPERFRERARELFDDGVRLCFY